MSGFRGANCDTHNILVAAERRVKVPESKRAAQTSDKQGFNHELKHIFIYL
jgi:hypothetical protein